MSSYYTRVIGNLKENVTARVEDIVQIQSNIQNAEQEYTKDMFGPSFILGSDENSFKLTATTDYIDQYNDNYDESKSWISFYDVYLRQSICTSKSSIESIELHMVNYSNVTTTIYAEIRDINLDIKGEASAVLEPTPLDDKYNTITFNFNIQHLPIGIYYFILRPVDISAIDLTKNGDETPYDVITSDMFMVRYDIDGEYHRNLTDYGTTEDDSILRGLEASYNGDNYLDAYLLPEQNLSAEDFNELDISDPNYDLFFKETYSSGNTYLVEYAEAVVLGQKVEPYDTHVKINGPSTLGDRVDLVTLKPNGTYEVIEGPVYNGEKIYPIDNSGLSIAYITTFKNGTEVSIIEQDDEYESDTRQRSLLERVRRVEKKADYQMTNNSPSRIKYSCEVDPVMFNNGLSTAKDTEGSYGVGITTNSNGEQVVDDSESISLMWSIINNNYTYSHEETKTTTAHCQVYNVDTSTTVSTPSRSTNGLYIVYLSKSNLYNNDDSRTIKNPINGETIKVTIKKGASTKHTKTLTTNSKGRATWNLNALKLKKGNYTVETLIPGNNPIKTTLKVHNGKYKVDASHKTSTVAVKDTIKTTVKEHLNKNTITGNDAFDNDNGRIKIDTKNGIIELNKADTSKDKVIYNTLLNTTNDPKFKYKTVTYTINSNAKETSEFPILHLKFDKDTYIKDIRPNVKTFKNMDKFGILLFKNDQVTNMRNHKRKTVEKNLNKDIVYTTIYRKEYSLKNATSSKNGKQTLKDFVTFKVNEPISAGTYSLLLYGRPKKNKDGVIYLRHYETLGNLDKYGLAAKGTGSSNLTTIKMKSSNLTSDSWNVLIGQRPHKYLRQGTVVSNPKNIPADIKTCSVDMNGNIPAGCSLRLYISNDGGAHWIRAHHKGKYTFASANNIFRWKMVLESNENHTPRLLYSKNKKYAIKFTLNTQTTYVPYEDYGRCYETPLLNANSITQGFVSNSNIKNRFSEWEWARIFMLDENNKSNIDICFSYNDEDITTRVTTLKSNWHKKTFFSQIFSDLKLSDFTSESIDYDNYDGNVEFDEHNYLFRMNSDYVAHNTNGINLAVPTASGMDYLYGNIAGEQTVDIIDGLFNYALEDHRYVYYGNENDDEMKYAGSQILYGPFASAIYKGSVPYNSVTDKNKYDYVINGVSFYNGVEVDETKAELKVQLYPITGTKNTTNQETIQTLQEAKDEAQATYEEDPSVENQTALQAAIDALNEAIDKQPYTGGRETFPSNSFNVNVGLTLDGTVLRETTTDSEGNEILTTTNGVIYPIKQVLKANEFNTVIIDISEHIEAFKANGIRSIGITVNEEAELKPNEGIGIGTINASSYNRRPYVPYMFSNWDRLKWETLVNDAQIYNLCTEKTNNATNAFLYPSYMDDGKTLESNISSLTSLASEFYKKSGTFIDISNRKNQKVTEIKRNQNTIKFKDGQNNWHLTSSTGDAVIFEFPANTTGNIFKINTDIPLSIYDLIDVEYYIYHTKQQNSGLTETKDLVDYDDYVVYDNIAHRYHGYISKGDIKIKLYTQTDIDEDTEPVEVLTLPAWGRVQQNARVTDKTVHAWFKKRSAATRIKSIVIERANPSLKGVDNIRLVLNNILFYNADTMPALGPQMQMRIYPTDDLSDIQIRKVGCVYRI